MNTKQMRKIAVEHELKHNVIGSTYADACSVWIETGESYHKDADGGRWVIPSQSLRDLVSIMQVVYADGTNAMRKECVEALRDTLVSGFLTPGNVAQAVRAIDRLPVPNEK